MNSWAIETGLVVPVPDLDDRVRGWRRRVGETADRPAHVTLMYPFAYPADTRSLSGFFARQAAFDFAFTSVGWFGEEFVYLTAEPAEPFRDLIAHIQARWPAFHPYGGRFPDPIPHLTIGARGDPDVMRTVAAEAAALLPIRCRAMRVLLMEGTVEPADWAVAASFRLDSPVTGTRPGRVEPRTDLAR